MKNWIFSVGYFAIAGVAMAVGCTGLTPRAVAKTVLDFADALCVVAHADTDEEAILKACMIERDFAPVVRDLVSSSRASSARAGACRPVDGGR